MLGNPPRTTTRCWRSVKKLPNQPSNELSIPSNNRSCGTECLVTKKSSIVKYIIYQEVLHQLRNYSNARPLSSHTITRLLANNSIVASFPV